MKDTTINKFQYNQQYLNSFSELPFSKKKNTILCSDAIKKNKFKIQDYKINPKKVVYHDSTFTSKKTQINYEELYQTITSETILYPENKGVSYSEENSNILFDSNFEQGNLKMAIEITPQSEYDIIMRKDYGNNKSFSWFYFSVTIKNIRNFIENNKADFDCDLPFFGNPKLENEIQQLRQHIKINILNNFKDSVTFGSLVPILCYNDYENKWSRNTFNVFYFSNGIQCQNLKNMNKSFQTLSFCFCLPKGLLQDLENKKLKTNSIKFYFAYNYPYSYTQLRMYIESISIPKNDNLIKFGSIGKTEMKNEIPLLVITNFNTLKNEENAKRKCVLLTARIHPGETSASYAIEGAISYLLSDSKIANMLREKFIFKIIPMLNPDGVIIGNYRFNARGKDLNRMWVDYSEYDSLTIIHMRKLIENTLENREIYLYCDFHGHSNKSNFFVYGCQKDNFPNFQNVFFKMLNEINPLCCLEDCISKINPSKIKTGRAIAKNEYKIDLSYCLESSMHSIITKNKKTGSKIIQPFTIQKYKQIGIDFCKALLNLTDENTFNRILTDLNTSPLFEENTDEVLTD